MIVTMQDYTITDRAPVLIGYEGENLSRNFTVKTFDDLSGIASFELLIGDVNCGAMTVNDTEITISLDSFMIGKAGYKKAQLIMLDDTGAVVMKSNQFDVLVGASNNPRYFASGEKVKTLTVNIDGRTRQIILPAGFAVSVNGDVAVDHIAFKAPASYGEFDFSAAACRVDWTGVDGTSHTNICTEKDADGNWIWALPTALTRGGEGEISFSVSYIVTDNGAVTADWNTGLVKFYHLESAKSDDAEEDVEEETTYDRLASAIAAVQAAQASVDDVAEVLSSLGTLTFHFVDAKADMTDQTKLYVLTTDGYLYYYSTAASDFVPAFEVGGSQEVIDARTDENGTTYANLKTRINTGFTQLKEDLNAKSPDLHTYELETNQFAQFEGTRNLFSGRGNLMIESAYYREPVGSAVGSPLRITSAVTYNGYLVRVKPNTTYIMGELDHRLYFYDSNFIYLGRTNNSDIVEGGPNICTTPANCYWMSLTFKKTRDLSSWMLVEGDTYPDTYISGYPRLNFIPKDPAYLTNKRIAFFGDSITAGSGTNKTYHEYIGERYGFTCLNYGYGGSGYVTSYTGTTGRHGIGEPGIGVANTQDPFTPNNVLARLAEPDPTTLDGAVIFAGTNDWSHHVKLTEFSAKLDETYTYYQTNYGAVPLVVMLPIHRLNDTTPEGKTMMDYCNIIIQKCREYGIPYVDTLAMSGLQPNNTGNSNVFFPRDDSTSNDGIHPNHIGHERIMRVVGEVLNGLVKYDDNVMR